MDFQYDQQLYKKHCKCKHLEKKIEKTLYLSPPGRRHCAVDVTGLVGSSLTGSEH